MIEETLMEKVPRITRTVCEHLGQIQVEKGMSLIPFLIDALVMFYSVSYGVLPVLSISVHSISQTSMGLKGLKVTSSSDRGRLRGIAAKSLYELKRKARDKLHVRNSLVTT